MTRPLWVFLILGLPYLAMATGSNTWVVAEDRLKRMGYDIDHGTLTNVLLDRSLPSQTRVLSARILGHRNTRRGIDVLLASLYEQDKDVRVAVTLALGESGNSRSVPFLSQLLQTNDDADVRYAVVNSLGKIADEECISALALVADDSSEPRVIRLLALQYLELNRPQAVSSSIRSLLGDPDPDIRAKSAVVISLFDPFQAVPQLVSALLNSDTSDWLQRDVVRALESAVKSSFVPTDPDYVDVSEQQRLALTMLNIEAWWAANSAKYPAVEN